MIFQQIMIGTRVMPAFNVILNETSIHRNILKIGGHLQCQKVNFKVNFKVKSTIFLIMCF